MISRVSENMKFNLVVNNLFSIQNKYNKLMEQMASQKKINRPSDDPLGMSRVLDYRKTTASIEQYRENIEHSKAWLTITESKLSSVSVLLRSAKELAVAQSTGTATDETRQIAAGSMQEDMIDGMLTLMNSKLGERYIFSGSKTDVQPFASSVFTATIENPVAATENNFDGSVSVTPAAAYTGTTNKTYVIKITGWVGGTRTATYDVSDDGGETWVTTGNTFVLPIAGSVATTDIGDGIDVTFTDDGTLDLAADDIFYVNGLTAGYYRGNGEDLQVEIGKDAPIAYNVPGESVFTDKGNGTIDIFDILNDLKTALENNNIDGIQAQIERLNDAENQVSLNIAKCGTRMNRLEIAEGTFIDLDVKIADLLASTEDADIIDLSTKLAMKEMALQASYRVATSIGQSTILNFLR